ncbi:hypothetical protein [Leifsonia sp. 2MCAF36]|uniref:hypothetical protein n=1 Tax=Leifsonia sp. 2MCAF36 TaxID=3232988 RepID=UPI003F98EC45
MSHTSRTVGVRRLVPLILLALAAAAFFGAVRLFPSTTLPAAPAPIILGVTTPFPLEDLRLSVTPLREAHHSRIDIDGDTAGLDSAAVQEIHTKGAQVDVQVELPNGSRPTSCPRLQCLQLGTKTSPLYSMTYSAKLATDFRNEFATFHVRVDVQDVGLGVFSDGTTAIVDLPELQYQVTASHITAQPPMNFQSQFILAHSTNYDWGSHQPDTIGSALDLPAWSQPLPILGPQGQATLNADEVVGTNRARVNQENEGLFIAGLLAAFGAALTIAAFQEWLHGRDPERTAEAIRKSAT